VARLPCRTCISIQMFAKKMCFPPNHTPVPGQSFENFIKGYSILAAEPDCAHNLSDMQWSRSIFCLALISNLAIAPFGSSAAGEERDIEIEAAGTGSDRMKFEIPSAEAEVALQQLANQADRPLVYLLDQVKGVRVNAVSGDYTLREALHRLVENTELKVVEDSMSGAWVVKPRKSKGKSLVTQQSNQTTELGSIMKEQKELIRRSFIAGLLATIMIGNSPHLLGQEEPPEEGEIEELSPFEVTDEGDVGYYSAGTTAGTRSAMKIENIPGSIQVINRKLLDDVNAFDVERALRVGVSGVSSNGNTREDFNFRGFRFEEAFRDGIQNQSSIGMPKYDIDRVEVVKGPAALTFGESGPLGGMINYVSRKPTAEPMGDIEIIFGSNNKKRATINSSGPVPIPQLEDNLTYRATLGWQEDDREKAIESDDQHFIGGALNYAFEKTDVLGEFYYFNTNGYIYFNDFADINAPSPGPVRFNPNSTDDFSPTSITAPNDRDVEIWMYRIQMTTELNENHSIKLHAKYRSSSQPNRRHLRGISVAEDNFTLNRQDVPFILDEDSATGQFDYIGKYTHPWFGGKEMVHNVSAGFQLIETQNRVGLFVRSLEPLDTRAPIDFSNDAADNVPVPPNPLLDADSDIIKDDTSWYVQSVTEFWGDKLLGIGGVRWIRTDDVVINLLADEDDPSRSDRNVNDVKQAWRAGGIFKPVPSLSIYGVKSTTFTVQNEVNNFGERFKDSSGILNEIGIKLTDFTVPGIGGKLFASFALFELTQTNVRQVRVVVLPDGTEDLREVQDAENSSEGIEFDLNYQRQIGPGRFESILNASIFSVENAEGIEPTLAPEEIYGGLLTYEFTEGQIKGLKVGVGGYYESDKRANITATTGFFIPSVTIFDAFVKYQYNENWRLGLNVNNIGDKDKPQRAPTTGLLWRRTGRQIEGSLTYSW